MNKKIEKFKNLTFEQFKELAKDDSLSQYEKIGFPDEYRKGKEEAIFLDIMNKLKLENSKNKTLLDIGIGCSDLSKIIINYCETNEINLLASDSQEMLDLLDDKPNLKKIAGYFPDETQVMISEFQEKIDYILCYSIFQYVFYNTCIYKFIDTAISLLKPGGKLLIADLPNVSKRKRFFTSDNGIKYHQNYTKSKTKPVINHLTMEPNHIDDGVVFGILQRYRNFGFETYLMPQGIDLPMANRREDILIIKN